MEFRGFFGNLCYTNMEKNGFDEVGLNRKGTTDFGLAVLADWPAIRGGGDCGQPQQKAQETDSWQMLSPYASMREVRRFQKIPCLDDTLSGKEKIKNKIS